MVEGENWLLQAPAGSCKLSSDFNGHLIHTNTMVMVMVMVVVVVVMMIKLTFLASHIVPLLEDKLPFLLLWS